jgi:hypothetical protein
MLSLAQRLGDARCHGIVTTHCSLASFDSGHDQDALEMASNALRLFRSAGDATWIAFVLTLEGEILRAGHDFSAAAERYEESAALGRELGDLYRIAVNLGNLSMCRLGLGDAAGAPELLVEQVKLNFRIGNLRWLPGILMNFAGAAARLGHARDGARWLGAAEKGLDARGHGIGSAADRDQHGMAIADLRGTLEPSEFAAAVEEGRALSLSDAIAEALAVFRRDGAQ